MVPVEYFFDLGDFEHQPLFPEGELPWTPLDRLTEYLQSFFERHWPLAGMAGAIDKPLVIYHGEIRWDCAVKSEGAKNRMHAYLKGDRLEGASIILPGVYLFDDRVMIGPGTVVEPGVMIKGPAVIGCNSEIRQGAYFRGNCLVGNKCVVGHTTEIKGSIMLDGSQAGHFAYIGDSILGRGVNLGAGTKLANLKMMPGSVIITIDKERYNTRRRKLGAILGDRTETGCNSVTSPGTLMGPHSIVYPCVTVPAGYYPGRTIITPSADSLRIRYVK